MTLFELRLAPNRSRLSCGKEENSVSRDHY